MAFALNKPQDAQKTQKKSPLDWIAKRSGRPGDELPEIDTAAGLDRALRGLRPAKPVPTTAPAISNPAREALAAIEASLYAIDRIRDSLEQACELVLSAKTVKDAGGRALLAERYDELRLSINAVIETLDERANQLIGAPQRQLDVQLGRKARYSVSPIRLDAGEKGLRVSPPRDAFATFDEVDRALEELDRALARADRAAANYCRDAQYLMARMNGDLGQ